MSPAPDPRVAMLLALGDDELVLGHRHSQWTGVAPHVEEDLAFSSIAQDEIGHAVMWYALAAELTGTDADSLGLGRAPEEYRSCALVERPNRDWAYTIARQYLYDTADDVRLQALAGSSWTPVREATGPQLREERYHLLHARTWLGRLAAGPVEARSNLARGLRQAFGEALGIFEPLPDEGLLVADGVWPVASSELQRRWLDSVSAELMSHGLVVPPEASAPPGPGGRAGERTEDFAEVWEEMTGLYRAYPGARW